MSELYVVSNKLEKPTRSLIDRARSHEIKDVDRFLKRQFGAQALSLEAKRMSELKGDLAIEADVYGCVAGVYRGIERVNICNQSPRQSRYLLGTVNSDAIPVAMFSTAGDYDLDVPDEFRLAMENNDTTMISYTPRIGLRLDEPVVFNSLVDNSSCEDDEEVKVLQSPPALHVVK